MSKPVNSLESLRDWLKTKDPNTTYNYLDTHDCLLCRYFKEKGLPIASVDGFGWTDTNKKYHALGSLNEAAHAPLEQQSYEHRYKYVGTYRNALKQTEELLEKANG